MAWIEAKGLSTDGLDEDSLRLLLLSLEGKYSVPKLSEVTNRGEVEIKFSSSLKNLDYK